MEHMLFPETYLEFWTNTRESLSSLPFFLVFNTYSSSFTLRDTVGPNQVCTLFGSTSGDTHVTGSAYLSAGYALNVSDLWKRNFLVLVGFFLLFQITQVLLIEYYPVSQSHRLISGVLLTGGGSNTWALQE